MISQIEVPTPAKHSFSSPSPKTPLQALLKTPSLRCRRFRGQSSLRTWVLTVDLKVHEAQEKVERQVFGGEMVIFENSETGELRRRKRVRGTGVL